MNKHDDAELGTGRFSHEHELHHHPPGASRQQGTKLLNRHDLMKQAEHWVLLWLTYKGELLDVTGNESGAKESKTECVRTLNT